MPAGEMGHHLRPELGFQLQMAGVIEGITGFQWGDLESERLWSVACAEHAASRGGGSAWEEHVPKFPTGVLGHDPQTPAGMLGHDPLLELEYQVHDPDVSTGAMGS